MAAIADPLREFVGTYLMSNTIQENEQWLAMTGRNLLHIADQIDREHERQTVERGSAHKVTHGTGEYGHTTCSACGVTVHRRDKWCWSCGAMLHGEIAEKSKGNLK